MSDCRAVRSSPQPASPSSSSTVRVHHALPLLRTPSLGACVALLLRVCASRYSCSSAHPSNIPSLISVLPALHRCNIQCPNVYARKYSSIRRSDPPILPYPVPPIIPYPIPRSSYTPVLPSSHPIPCANALMNALIPSNGSLSIRMHGERVWLFGLLRRSAGRWRADARPCLWRVRLGR